MHETLELLRRTLREMWHRRWIGLLAAWIVGLLAITIVYRIPERYEATARLFVDTESLLKPLLAGLAVQPNIDQQVALISRTLISRPNVEKVVRMSDLDLRARSDAERDQLVEEVMAKVRLVGSTSTNLYSITYQDPDPEQARKVVQSLLTIFVESSLGDKRQDSRAAVRFLDEQIKHYERTLQSAEGRLKEFKLKYLGLAERDSGGNGDYFSRLGTLQSQIEVARLELRAAEQGRDAYKQELAGEKPTFLDTPGPQVVVPTGSDTVPEIDERLTQLRVALDGLTRRFTDNHPDVANTRRIIGELEEQRRAALAEKQRAAAAASPAGATKPVERNPVFQQLRISLVEAEAQVASARAKLAGLEGQYAQLKSRAAMVPQVEAEFAQLNRDYEVQRRTYESLLTRRESATMGIGVQDTGGAQFRVIDPPRVSPRPVFPNRLALLGVATLASIAAGILGAFLASQISPTFLDTATLRRATSRPVLGSVSILPSPGRAVAMRRRNWIFAGGLSGLVAVLAAAVGYALLLWRTAI